MIESESKTIFEFFRKLHQIIELFDVPYSPEKLKFDNLICNNMVSFKNLEYYKAVDYQIHGDGKELVKLIIELNFNSDAPRFQLGKVL